MPQGAAGKGLIPQGPVAPVAIQISGKIYQYVPLDSERPLVVPIDGPAVFEAIARWRFDEQAAPVDLDVEVLLDGSPVWHSVFVSRPGPSTYPEHEGWIAGRPERIVLEVPSGEHVVELRLRAPAAGTLDVNLISRPPLVLPWRLGWRAGVGASYDSNVFRYSDGDVDDFIDGKGEDRYPDGAVDDLRVEPAVRLSLTREEPGRRETRLEASGDWRLMVVNGEKSFAKLGATFIEWHDGVAYLRAEYAAIPRYHLRNVWDPDIDEWYRSPYQSCEFRKHGTRVTLGSDRSLPVDLEGTWKYETYAYGQDFVEYDARAHTVALRATARPRKGIRVDIGYGLRMLTARGYDQVGETRSTSDDSDTTYDQDEYDLRVRWEAGRWWGFPTVVHLRGALKRRFYLTDGSGEDDPYHAGREDTYWTFSAKAALRLSGNTTLEAFAEHRRRSSESEFVPDIGDTKDYTANRVGVKLTLEGGRFLD